VGWRSGDGGGVEGVFHACGKGDFERFLPVYKNKWRAAGENRVFRGASGEFFPRLEWARKRGRWRDGRRGVFEGVRFEHRNGLSRRLWNGGVRGGGKFWVKVMILLRKIYFEVLN